MQSVCKVRSRLEGFQGHFFWLLLVFWLQDLSGPGVHGAAGHHGASQGLTGLMASPGAPQRPGVRCAPLELHSQAAHFGPGT